MAKHTPGPWRAQMWMQDDSFSRVFGPKGETVADIHNPRNEGVLNQELIAAAPELKDSLKWALDALEASDLSTWPDSNGWDADAYKIGLQQVRDALAKAGVDRG